ncbi:MAG: Lar family restriction alleviation protein [Chitinophagaceae bacterium]
MKQDFLMACPFCGSFEVHINRSNKTACWVECAVCNAEASSGKTREEAIERWNNRVQHLIKVSASIVYDGDKEFKADMKRIAKARR